MVDKVGKLQNNTEEYLYKCYSVGQIIRNFPPVEVFNVCLYIILTLPCCTLTIMLCYPTATLTVTTLPYPPLPNTSVKLVSDSDSFSYSKMCNCKSKQILIHEIQGGGTWCILWATKPRKNLLKILRQLGEITCRIGADVTISAKQCQMGQTGSTGISPWFSSP